MPYKVHVFPESDLNSKPIFIIVILIKLQTGMLWRNKERNQLYIGLEGVSWIVKTMTFFCWHWSNGYFLSLGVLQHFTWILRITFSSCQARIIFIEPQNYLPDCVTSWGSLLDANIHVYISFSWNQLVSTTMTRGTVIQRFTGQNQPVITSLRPENSSVCTKRALGPTAYSFCLNFHNDLI